MDTDNGYKVIERDEFSDNAKIKVVGVGGGGGNMLNFMIEKGIKNIEMIAANTDAQALQKNNAPIKIQLGKELTKGLGAGMEPEVGKEAAEESYDELKQALQGADLVFISAGMGGGTGTGAAPVIAKIAKELNALTIAVITKPFKREGAKRRSIAEVGFNLLKEECDSIVTILNQKLLTIIDRKAGMREAYKMVDNVLFQAVSGITSIILGEGHVNADFNDVKKVIMTHRGMALMGIGYKSGENSAHEALSEAIESPLLDDVDIMNAKGLLINTTINENYPLVDLDEAMDSVLGELMENEEVTIIQGEAYDNSLTDDEIKITIIATGFDDNEKNKPINLTNKHNELSKHLDSLSIRKVIGGNDLGVELTGEDIDVPTWVRNSAD